MNEEEFDTFRQTRAGQEEDCRPGCIDLAGPEGERFAEELLADLYGCILRLVDLLEQRYETSLEEDLALLCHLGVDLQDDHSEEEEDDTPGPRPAKRQAMTAPSREDVKQLLPQGVRPENATNILLR